MEPLYVASRNTRDKAIVLVCSVFLGALSIWWLFGETISRLTGICAVLLIVVGISETFVQKLSFTDSELLYTNIFGKQHAMHYSDIASLRYVAGSELRITAADGSRVKVSYGDFPRMISIIGEKTNRKPPLEIGELSPRLARWFGFSSGSRRENK